jgi:hypothetical protein
MTSSPLVRNPITNSKSVLKSTPTTRLFIRKESTRQRNIERKKERRKKERKKEIKKEKKKK